MSHRSVLKSLHSLSKLRQRDQFLDLLAKSSIMKSQTSTLEPKDVATLIYSFANLRVFDKNYWKTLEKFYNQKHLEMTHQDFANCIWGFSKSSLPQNSPVWQSLEDGALAGIDNFSAREISTISLAFAQVGRSSPVLWDKIKTMFLSKVKEMSPADLVLMSWAFSKVGIDELAIWHHLERNLLIEFEDLEPKSKSTAIYAFAKIGKGSANLWAIFENGILTQLTKFDPRCLANCVWGLSKMNRSNTRVWERVVTQLKNKLSTYNNIDAVNCIWAIHKAGKIDKELIEIVHKLFTSESRINSLHHQDILNLAWVLYNEGVLDPKLWDQLALRTKKVLTEESGQFHFKAHKCFFNLSTAYWELFGDVASVNYIGKVAKANNASRTQKIENLTNVIDIGYYCAHMDLGSSHFWDSFKKSLRIMMDSIEGTDLLAKAKLMFILAMKVIDDPVMWKWEGKLWEDRSSVEKLVTDSRVVVIMLWALLIEGRPESLLKELESKYKSLKFEETSKANLSITIKLIKDKAFTAKVPFKTLIKDLYKNLDTKAQDALVEAIFEDLFRVYLGREYPANPVYEKFLSDLKEKSEVYEKENANRSKKEESNQGNGGMDYSFDDEGKHAEFKSQISL